MSFFKWLRRTAERIDIVQHEEDCMTYRVEMKCENCDKWSYQRFLCGQAVTIRECPVCGCKTLTYYRGA